MPFKFSIIVELFEELERSNYEQRATYAKQVDPSHRIVGKWFQQYSDDVARNGHAATAFLSAMFPERRPDRSYSLQEARLAQLVARVLGLGATRAKLLRAYKEVDGPDFATCVERVMKETEIDLPTESAQVSLEEIDLALTEIAAGTISSAAAVRAQKTGRSPTAILAPVFHRLRSNEAKWLVRMIHKSYKPIDIPEYKTLHEFHFMLPKLLEIQNSFDTAVTFLSRPEIAKLPARPSRDFEVALMPFVFKEIIPEIGTMICRQPLEKARSIKHCVKLADSRIMSVERKYDGEYCQIHVRASGSEFDIQIFSKSGRDSTQDRAALHDCIRLGLGLGKPECKIQKHAIFEGELVVYSMEQQTILPFHHIRKHVLHGGKRIGTALDSPKQAGEHLMIVFFDILLLDGQMLLNEPHQKRRQFLKAVVLEQEGNSRIAERALIDFSHRNANSVLRKAFGTAIRRRWEGFVLKGLTNPYLSLNTGARSIKLKKDYIAGLGDSADMCVVGGGRETRAENDLDLGRLTWTHFYVACLLNKDEVLRYDARPHFRILDRLGPGCLSKDAIKDLNVHAQSLKADFVFASPCMLIEHPRTDFPVPTDMFTKPIVIEVMGAGFGRPQTVDFFTIRFPRNIGSKIKVHRDRSIADIITFDELQHMAHESTMERAETASQEDIEWIGRLEAADSRPNHIVDKSQSTSSNRTPRSASTISLPSLSGRRVSTQPTLDLIRIDARELTSQEWQCRYSNSVPQTPTRPSQSTVSNHTVRLSIAPERHPDHQDSEQRHARRSKRRRVAFDIVAAPTQIAKPAALKEVKNTATHVAHNAGHGAGLTSLSRGETGKKSTERVSHNLPTTALAMPTPAAETIRTASSTQANPLRSCINIPARRKLTSGWSPTNHIDSRAVFDFIMEPISSPRSCHAEVMMPLYVAPSVCMDPRAVRLLNSCSDNQLVGFTTRIEKFLRVIREGQRAGEGPRKHIFLVDSADARRTIEDLQNFMRAVHGCRGSDFYFYEHIELLIFDYRVVQTDLSRSGFGMQHASEQTFNDCDEFFCGTLNIASRTTFGSRQQIDFGLVVNWEPSVLEVFSPRGMCMEIR